MSFFAPSIRHLYQPWGDLGKFSENEKLNKNTGPGEKYIVEQCGLDQFLARGCNFKVQ